MSKNNPKLIEVALPLAVINDEAGREKSIRHGHPSTLHLWWARRPLAAARAVLWASLVDDPSADPSLSQEEQERERQRLFRILERLVKWEHLNDPYVLGEARAEIERCYPDGPPPVLDPFGGGGTIPLEAQRLGLEAHAGDLNPVAVLIHKGLIEIPPRFAGQPPVHPDVDKDSKTWKRAEGLAADVEAYGRWMRDEAERRIGDHYPLATTSDGQAVTPVAWIWARTVRSPDPSWPGHVPLVASWELERKKGKSTAWIEPIVDHESHTIEYRVQMNGSPTHERTVNRGNGTCLATGSAIPYSYIRDEAAAGRMGSQLMAIVAEGDSGREYCTPTDTDREAAGNIPDVAEKPTARVGTHPRNISTPPFGMDEWWKHFSPRQLMALTVFSDLIDEVRQMVVRDAQTAGLSDNRRHLREGGSGPTAYSEAISTYLAFVVDKCADYWSTIATWATGGFIRSTFARQAIQMTWDYAECNPFSDSTGNWMAMVDWVRRAIDALPANRTAMAEQRDARARVDEVPGALLSTDPPYYDNISYADLSDFFYVWMRRNLKDTWPNECSTLLTPKAEELIANPYRAGSKGAAEKHFESGMAEFMNEVATADLADAPTTIYYAYKATETSEGEVRSTGWDTFLQAVLDAGLQVMATWPLRTERSGRMISVGTNALASSIVLVCRPRIATAPLASRGEFIAALRDELPEAVRLLQSGNIAPVDLPQSTIGPGIKVFSRYSRVVEADGSTMRVASALSIINDVLAEVIDGEESELDADTRFAVTWYSQHGWNPARAGDADAMARAKNTSLGGIQEAGIGDARAGQFRLYERNELDSGWSPQGDVRLTVWEATQQLVAALETSESDAAALLYKLGGVADRARALAYVLFQKASDKGWAEEAASYNSLITAWPTLQALGAAEESRDAQGTLL